VCEVNWHISDERLPLVDHVKRNELFINNVNVPELLRAKIQFVGKPHRYLVNLELLSNLEDELFDVVASLSVEGDVEKVRGDKRFMGMLKAVA
jgi:hypothetical protein